MNLEDKIAVHKELDYDVWSDSEYGTITLYTWNNLLESEEPDMGIKTYINGSGIAAIHKFVVSAPRLRVTTWNPSMMGVLE